MSFKVSDRFLNPDIKKTQLWLLKMEHFYDKPITSVTFSLASLSLSQPLESFINKWLVCCRHRVCHSYQFLACIVDNMKGTLCGKQMNVNITDDEILTVQVFLLRSADFVRRGLADSFTNSWSSHAMLSRRNPVRYWLSGHFYKLKLSQLTKN